MKHKFLLLLFIASCSVAAHAQKKSQKVSAYAITSEEKGSSRWTEVKLVDIISGEAIQSVYQSKSEIPVLNARTKKPVMMKDIVLEKKPFNNIITTSRGEKFTVTEIKGQPGVYITTEPDDKIAQRRVIRIAKTVTSNAPFSTNSAACAYDKKHDRLYYTPMGINQLRYIDLKTGTPTIYYFEDEPLGTLNGPHDVPNQVTRMAIGSDGNGYALTNNAEHLIRFTTNKKAKITDLGTLTDDASNGKFSIHNRSGYGGDMVADEAKNLYVITGNRRVFKVDIKTLVATYKGTIKGLPAGFTTNGAAVEKGTSIIVTSSTNTSAYYKFDLETLQAEKISTGTSVYNASDLANGNLLTEIKNKKDEPVVKEAEEVLEDIAADRTENTGAEKISVYPNPVTNGIVKISFQDYQPGLYEIQLVDLNGKSISSQLTNINGKTQVVDYRLPAVSVKGSYFLKVLSNSKRLISTEKVIVQ